MSKKTNSGSWTPGTWDPYPQWQTPIGREANRMIANTRECYDANNFRTSITAWSPDKFNYTPDMNNNIALNFVPFRK